MKLLVISSVMPPFQAAEADYAWQFCRHLVEQGHQVELLTNAREKIEAPPGVRVRAVMESWQASAFPRLWRELRDAAPEGVVLLYIGWMYDRHPLATFLPTITRWALPNARFASVFYNRYGADPKHAGLARRLFHKALKSTTGEPGLIYEYGTLFTESHRVFAFSAQHAAVYKTVWPKVADRLEVLPSLPLLRFSSRSKDEARAAGRAKIGAGPDDFLLAFFGYVYPSKGIETLLAALQHLPARFRLAIVGGVLDRSIDFPDYANGLRADATARGLAERVHWTGNYDWDNEAASEILYGADAVVLPFDEGVSLNNSSFAASAWHDQPIVSTTRPDTEPEFRSGENILLVPPKNPQALAQAIEKVANDRSLAQRLARGARQLAEARLNWHGAVARVVASLKESNVGDYSTAPDGGLKSSFK